jgi:hypothetical protein
MTKKTPRTRVERAKASSYRSVGAEFIRSAQMAAGHGYWNAAGLLCVHAAIAYADALCIALAGMKSTSDNHLDAIALLGEASAQAKDRDPALAHLRRIIEEKNRVSCTGQSFRERDAETLAMHAERFAAWAERVLGT